MADVSRPRASPIADPIADQVLERADELAKRWASSLVLARPLDAIGEVPLVELAREAPALVVQVLRAVGSNVELERLTGAGQAGARESLAAARRIAAISGARDAGEAAEAVEALRGVLWEALLDGLGRSLSDRSLVGVAAAVCDRLAYVCAAALAAGVDAAFGFQAQAGGEVARTAASEPVVGVSGPASSAGRQAVIVDELVGGHDLGGRSRVEGLASTPAAVGDRPAPAEIAIHDQRGEEGPAAWVGLIGAQLERFDRDGVPFAVLLVELADIERLRHEQPARELARLAGEVEGVVTEVLGAEGVVLTRERPGRCWLLAPNTDRSGARHLADRLMSALPSGVNARRASLEVAVGTAVCPEDGREPATLAAYADVALFAARAAIRASTARPGAPLDESG